MLGKKQPTSCLSSINQSQLGCARFIYIEIVAKSGCRYLSEKARTNRYCNTFLPTSNRLLNARSGRGEIGEGV